MGFEFKTTRKKAITTFIEMTCKHQHIVFFKKDLAFCCEECIEEIIQVETYNEFRLFCEFSGKKENELLSGVFFYIKYYYVKLAKKVLKKK